MDCAAQMQRELKMHGHSMQRESKPAAASVAAASRGSSGADGSKGDKESTGEEGKEKKPAAEKKRAVTPAIDKRFFNRLAFVMRIVVSEAYSRLSVSQCRRRAECVGGTRWRPSASSLRWI
jgi:hypothetical protein